MANAIVDVLAEMAMDGDKELQGILYPSLMSGPLRCCHAQRFAISSYCMLSSLACSTRKRCSPAISSHRDHFFNRSTRFICDLQKRRVALCVACGSEK